MSDRDRQTEGELLSMGDLAGRSLRAFPIPASLQTCVCVCVALGRLGYSANGLISGSRVTHGLGHTHTHTHPHWTRMLIPSDCEHNEPHL